MPQPSSGSAHSAAARQAPRRRNGLAGHDPATSGVELLRGEILKQIAHSTGLDDPYDGVPPQPEHENIPRGRMSPAVKDTDSDAAGGQDAVDRAQVVKDLGIDLALDVDQRHRQLTA